MVFDFVASLKPLTLLHAPALRRLFSVACVAWFAWAVSGFYAPGEGFTSLVAFGEKRSAQYIPELRATTFHVEPDSHGYDAQYYAQLAMQPALSDPDLRPAIDNLPYRARRILFCWTAYAAAWGDPVRALHIYAVQNIVAWFLLAWLLLRWFPATSWNNTLRWAAVMFTSGLIVSVRCSLVDGPSLLLLACGMVLLEKGATWSSAALLGIAGMGKETNLLAGAVHFPSRFTDTAGWAKAIGRGVLLIAPLAAWLVYVHLTLGPAGGLGSRNFDWPFAGYIHKWRETWDWYQSGHVGLARGSVAMLIALTVQWLFFAFRPRWSDPWWRLGAAYALLMAVLGTAVWEGFPGAAARVLLPMTFAFNVFVPRGRRWLPLLIAGNLLVLLTPDTLSSHRRKDTDVTGPYEAVTDRASGRKVTVTFKDGWYGPESTSGGHWRWSRQDGEILVQNPHEFRVTAAFEFRLKAAGERTVTLRTVDAVLWSGRVDGLTKPMRIEVPLPPGASTIVVESDGPPSDPPGPDDRLLTFCFVDFETTVLPLGRAGG